MHISKITVVLLAVTLMTGCMIQPVAPEGAHEDSTVALSQAAQAANQIVLLGNNQMRAINAVDTCPGGTKLEWEENGRPGGGASGDATATHGKDLYYFNTYAGQTHDCPDLTPEELAAVAAAAKAAEQAVAEAGADN